MHACMYIHISALLGNGLAAQQRDEVAVDAAEQEVPEDRAREVVVREERAATQRQRPPRRPARSERGVAIRVYVCVYACA